MATKPETNFTSQPSMTWSTISPPASRAKSGWCLPSSGGRLVNFTTTRSAAAGHLLSSPLRGDLKGDPLGGFPQQSARRDFVMKRDEKTNEEPMGVCTNSHCFEDTCRGECCRDYHYQALRLIRRRLDEVKRLDVPIRGPEGV